MSPIGVLTPDRVWDLRRIHKIAKRRLVQRDVFFQSRHFFLVEIFADLFTELFKRSPGAVFFKLAHHATPAPGINSISSSLAVFKLIWKDILPYSSANCSLFNVFDSSAWRSAGGDKASRASQS